MNVLEFLNLQHTNVIKTEQTLEKTNLEILKNKTLQNKKTYSKLVSISKKMFETDLPMHFKVEELIIFPIIEKKLQDGDRIVTDMIFEHRYFIKQFDEIKDLNDYNKFIKIFSELMKTLSNHAIKEDKIFSSIHFSVKEQSIADHKARSLGFDII